MCVRAGRRVQLEKDPGNILNESLLHDNKWLNIMSGNWNATVVAKVTCFVYLINLDKFHKKDNLFWNKVLTRD